MSYTLDDVGNRTQRVDQQGTHTYAYDDVYRLTSVTHPGPSTTSYTFHAFGNRTSMTDGSGTTHYTYDDGDRLTSVDPPAASATSYTCDDNGSLTARGSDSFAWDYEERVGVVAAAAFVAQGLMAGCNVERMAAIGFTTGLSLGADLDQLPASLFHPQMKLLRSCEHQVTPTLLNESGK